MKRFSMIMLGCFLSLIVWNNAAMATDNPTDGEKSVAERLGVKVPEGQKFVVVTAAKTSVLREPARSSARLVNCVENWESDMADSRLQWSDAKIPKGYHKEPMDYTAGRVLAVLGEKGDYYKVSVKWMDEELESGYMRKADTKEVKPEPLTVELLDQAEEWASMPKVVKMEGKYKGMVIMSEIDDLWGYETLRVGVLQDGALMFPVSGVGFIACAEGSEEIDFEPEMEGPDLLLSYPKSLAQLNERGNVLGLDPAKLTDEQIERILDVVSKRPFEYMYYEYYFPMLEEYRCGQFWLKR